MPFDRMNEQRLNCELLARELRENPPKWWNYSSCKTCAVALAVEMGLFPKPKFSLNMQNYIADLRRIFGDNEPFTNLHNKLAAGDMTAITPAMVADALESPGPY